MAILNKQSLSSWGNFPTSQAFLKRPEHRHELCVSATGATLARGLGRSYGDAAINTDQQVILMERMNRFYSFDNQTGILRAEGGVSLAEILDAFIPRGWFLPVTPGTKFATLGGCFATDVHGKNHHVQGTFSNHVKEIELLLADGSHCRCSPTVRSDLFWATAGGLGLTGIITEVTLQLTPIETSLVSVTYRAMDNIYDLLDYLDRPNTEHYSVAWIDCLSKGNALGRSIVMDAHHAKSIELSESQKKVPLSAPSSKSLTIPCFFPNWTINRWVVRGFNSIYYSVHSRKHKALVDFNAYFYPLDAINHWNRIYGKKGFLQYQCVIPLHHAKNGMPAILKKLAGSCNASFLAVLKRFGPQGKGLLSFPFEGITLALDIPIASQRIFSLLDQLDELVMSYDGRVYLAKDARLSPKAFCAMYPRYREWMQVKKTVDPHTRFNSDLARRLEMGKIS